ncbi:type I-F CRISPR-associated protein Csy1 [Salinisphaera aquimarina]|uniref:Type I-F CRISPR-associated protein Csy1 n=1 Tax=Salinisphaera aquimarina TaxID=2094031 RepID=A0ABV7EQF8_9GAMM
METTSASEIRQKIAAFIVDYENSRSVEDAEKLESESFSTGLKVEEWLLECLEQVPASHEGRNPIRLATHVVKNMHPDIIRADCLFRPASKLNHPNAIVGTKSLGSESRRLVDVVGNAASPLERMKLAALEIDGQTILDLAKRDDSRLANAFVDDHDIRQRLMDSFCLLDNSLNRTHPRSKQIYWLSGDDPSMDEDFHLLAPLYATSLVHRVFKTINRDRFSEESKTARDARYEDQPLGHGYCEYPTLGIQRFGGDNGKRNISQLNGERNGRSYLLSSAPPLWRSRTVAPIRANSGFRAYAARPAVRPAIRALAEFLAEDPATNRHTRDYRDQLTAELVDELIVFTSEMHQLAPGWTDDWHCRLPFEQQCWLDPYRAGLDREFAERMLATDWWPTICDDFSRWVNARLEWHVKHAMGDPEHKHFSKAAAGDPNARRAFEFVWKDWQTKLEKELAALPEVFNDDDE